MDDELVLLTSYFNLAGGRRQDTADTFRVESSVPSETSPDGVAAVYIVTEGSSAGSMGGRARRVAADTIAWEYQQHTDVPPPARLKAALRAAHDAVVRESDGHVTVGASVIAVEADNIYLAQVAPGQVYVLHEGHLHSINAADKGDSPFANALGGSRVPRVALFRDQIEAGDVLTLCSSWFERTADPDELRECFGAGTADDIAEAILELAKEHDVRDSTVVVIEAALASELELPPDEDEPPGFLEQIDGAMQSLAGVGRMLWSELWTPAANGTADGARALRKPEREDFDPAETEPRARTALIEPESPPEDWAARRSGARPVYRDDSTSEVPIVEPGEPAPDITPLEIDQAPARGSVREQMTEEFPVISEPDTGSSAWERQDETDDLAEPVPPADNVDTDWEVPEEPRQTRPRWNQRRAPEDEPMSELEQVNSRLQHDNDMGDVIPPIQAFPDTSTEPSRIYATSKDMQAANRRPRRFGGIARPVGGDDESGTPMVRPGLGDVDLRRPVSRSAPPAVVWAAAAIFLLLVAVSLYKFVFSHKHSVATVNYVALITRDLQHAKSANTLALQDFYLQKARNDIARARVGGTDPRKLATFSATVQETSDNLHHITRVANPAILTDFAKIPNARPSEIASSPGLVFVLDAGGHKVFQVTPNTPAANPTQIVAAGETDNTFTIGNPLHIASDGTTVLVLDDHNVLVRDSAGNKTVTSLVQSAPNERTVQMTTLDPDVYLLDTASSQLWRYPQGATAYNPISQPYWDANKPDLSHAVAAGFDGTSLYILRQNSTILKYDLSANAQHYTVSVQPPVQNPTGMFTGPGQKFVWVADPAHQRIVQLDKFGAFIRAYVSGAFAQIEGISVGPAGNTLYVLAGSKLYDLPVVR